MYEKILITYLFIYLHGHLFLYLFHAWVAMTTLVNKRLHTCTQYLVWVPFALRIASIWHGGDQPVAQLMCYGSQGCLASGLQLVCTVGYGVSHLPLDNTHTLGCTNKD